MKNKKIVLIDGSSCVHRAYHALPPLTGPEGIPVNAAYGFLKMLNKIIKNQQPGYMLVAFDHKKPTFRHERYPDYKAQRKKTDRELLQQFPLIFEILDLLKIKRISFEGFEADDIIATLAKKARKKNMPVSIVTGDKDIMQVVKKGVLITDGMKNKIYDEKAIKEKLGVEPRFVTDYLALIGDKSDNLPGVRGIGPVSAARLINRYGGLDSIYASLDKIDERYRKKLVKHKESAYLTFNMVKLVGDIDLPVKIEDCRRRGPDKEKLKEKFEYLNFNSIVSDWIKKDELKDEIKTRTLSEYGKVRSFVLKHASCKQVFIYPFFESGVLRGVGISYSGKECVYLPSGRSLLNPGGGLEKKEINKIFKDYILKNSALATYDFKSLYKYFKKQGAGKARPAFDCISADYVVSGESGKRSLDKMAKKHLGWSPGSEKPASASAIKETESLVGSKINAVFNIKEVLEKKIKKNKLDELYYKIELPVLKVLAEMEIRGIKADREKLKQVEKEFSGELKKVEENIFSEAGEKFNVNSSKQLSRILFHKLKLKPLRKTATGYSTADDVLEELESAHPLPAMIRRYRGLQKLLSTYIYPLPRSISEETSRINTTFNITGTSTGRLSSTEPNLQNIPVKTRRGTKIRKSFIAEKGNIFLSADYSQIDLRALAHISGDKNLIQSFRRGEDIHRRTAAAVFEVDEDDVDADMRNKAKAVNFGIVYGMSAWGLEKRSDMSKSEAETFIERYFSAYPGVKKYMDEIVEKAGKKKYVTTIFNRRRYLPEINSSNYNRRLTSERMAINTPIQGSSADIIKKAMVRLDRELDFNRGEIKLILQIHDELLFELPLSLEKKARALIKNLMENAARLKVPLPVEFKRGTDWGSLKSC